jgi:hypothetical protein
MPVRGAIELTPKLNASHIKIASLAYFPPDEHVEGGGSMVLFSVTGLQPLRMLGSVARVAAWS